MMNRSYFKKLSFLILTLTSFNAAHAFNSIINSGNLTEQGTYKLGSELQFLTDEPSGANILFYIDLPTKFPSLDYRIKFGTGETDLNLGVAAKWVPVPDLQNQPALGFIFDVDWINNGDFNYSTFRAAPLISKNFKWEYGAMTPYAALPIGARLLLEDPGPGAQDEFDFFVQLTFGVELDLEAYQNLTFFGEAGFDIDEAFNYFSLSARYKM